MDDFTKDEDQQFFDHINQQSDDQSDDQTDDEGVGRPMTPSSPPLQYWLLSLVVLCFEMIKVIF